MLFEMLQGDVIDDGWRDKHVRESLDLCLACKGCKHECPVNVDMATYKAEFLSHYYAWRVRPRQAYAMGWIYWWARLASKMPRVANFLSQTKPFSSIAKWTANVSQSRTMPKFASPTFRDWFEQNVPTARAAGTSRNITGKTKSAACAVDSEDNVLRHEHVPRFQTDSYPLDSERHRLNPPKSRQTYVTDRVLVWPDTFNNYLNTDAAISMTRILRELGYRVELPPRPLCCGRPLYDWGMLKTARRLLEQTLDTLQPWITAGVPLVGIEPSCVAVFRDEMIEVFPHREDARILSKQTFIFSEFMEMQNHEIPQLHRKALVHGHCHHKSVIHMDAEVSVLKKLGLEYEIVDDSCCGMAGAFGFASEHYDVSVKIGEQTLCPAVHAADDDTLIIANGFSCQQQIEQLTGRKAMHLAQVVEMAMNQDS